jgi:hypothetical protein
MALRTLISRGRKAALLVSAVTAAAAATVASADPQLMFEAPASAGGSGTDLTTLAGPDQSTGDSLVSGVLGSRPGAAAPAAATPTPALSGDNATTSLGSAGDGILDFFYDPGTGHLFIKYDGDTRVTAAQPFQVVRFKSAGGHFIPANFNQTDFGAGVTATTTALNGTASGANSVPDNYDLGAVLPTGLTAADLTADLTLQWNVFGGGLTLKNGDVTVPVPEPTTVGLVGLAAASMLLRRRKQS